MAWAFNLNLQSYEKYFSKDSRLKQIFTYIQSIIMSEQQSKLLKMSILKFASVVE